MSDYNGRRKVVHFRHICILVFVRSMFIHSTLLQSINVVKKTTKKESGMDSRNTS